jgi:hypothetical protein
MASRPKARNQVADFCSAPMAGYYAAVDTRHYSRSANLAERNRETMQTLEKENERRLQVVKPLTKNVKP